MCENFILLAPSSSLKAQKTTFIFEKVSVHLTKFVVIIKQFKIESSDIV